MIESGQSSFEDLVAKVSEQHHVWLRIGSVRKDGGWTALVYDLVAPEPPPGWAERTWRYEQALFSALAATGETVAEWLRAGTMTVDGSNIMLPDLPREAPSDRVRAHGLASHQDWELYEPLPWPSAAYELASQQEQGPQGMLIGTDSPSFYRFLDAVFSFFGLRSRLPVSNLPVSALRLQDIAGRIDKVTVHPGSVEIRVEGRALGGLAVELAGQAPELLQEELTESGGEREVSFSIPEGLPEQAWVVLKSGSTCVDRKFINWMVSASASGLGVEIVPDPSTALEALVNQGEGPTIEFKREVPADDHGRRKVSRTLAAFANGDGGHVLFGVDDAGHVAGLGEEEVTLAARDTVTRWITDLVAPHLTFDVRAIVTQDDRHVLDVEVTQGDAPPYGVAPANPQYYLRRGATTFPATVDDVRTLARRGVPAETSPRPLYAPFI